MGVESLNVIKLMLSKTTKKCNRPLRTDEKKVVSNWKQRVKFGLLIFTSFSVILYLGSLAVALTILLVQVMCYKEILNINYENDRCSNSRQSKLTAWYFFTVWNYCLIGETFVENFRQFFTDNAIISTLFAHCRFKSFCMYFFGIVIFVVRLKRNSKLNVDRFRLLAVFHVLLIVLTVPTYLFLKCLFEGMIWVVVPITSVTLNDIFAYIFGKLMGKTPLIHVSPNKTWEGFIGGAVGTIITTLLISNLTTRFSYFTCPTEYDERSAWIAINSECSPNYMFERDINEIFGFEFSTVPFDLVALYIALFASLIAPFAGFFASGFKRAFNIKDFSDTIPGHGGILDRFDCQFLMAIFMFVYLSTFVKNTNFKKLYGKIMKLNDNDLVVLYDLLRLSLEDRKML